jgi:hypothetical protein
MVGEGGMVMAVEANNFNRFAAGILSPVAS